MNRRKPINTRQLAREKLLFRYSSALERGDFDALASVLRHAESDPVLEKMLMDMDAVYRAEIKPLPVLPSLSSNHNHRHAREDNAMNVAYPTIARRLPDTRSRGRWNSAVTLAAALVALVLFAALLIARRPPTDPQQGSPGLALQGETATPIPSSTPLTLHMIVSLTPTLVFMPTIVNPTNSQMVLCQAFVNLAAGINVLSRPSELGVEMGYLPLGTQLTITDTAADSTFWFFVNGIVDGIPVQGWVSGGDLSFTSDQSCPMPSEIQAIQATNEALGIQPISPDMVLTLTAMPPCQSEINALPITPTFPPTPTLPPDGAVEPIDGISATATAVVADATAMAQPTILPPTAPPCVMQIPPTFVPYIPPDATPIAVFDLALRSGEYVLLTIEQVGDIPANARVRVNSAQYTGSEWLYDVIAQEGQTRGQAREWQLQYAPDVTPGAATPTAIFGGAIGMGFYAAITNQPVGDIPAGTRVQISSAWFDGIEWIYNITDEAGRDNAARESQLDVAPDYTPGMSTPTAAYFDLRGQVLLTLEQVGSIPPNTPVQATSGYYDGTEWVYGVITLDASAYGDARASQLRVVSLEQAGVQPTLPPTPFPSTLTPTATPFS